MSFFNEAAMKTRIAEVLGKIRGEADPEVLNAGRSLFRKQVPFFMRAYVAAYLLMEADKAPQGKRRPGPARSEAAPREDRTEVLRQVIPDDEAQRIFVSVGRNRRVFPRELLGLIMTETAVPKEDIGVIRVLDNYSFIQVRTGAAQTVIDALDGKQFRGRTLAVNFARARKETEEEAEPLSDDQP